MIVLTIRAIGTLGRPTPSARVRRGPDSSSTKTRCQTDRRCWRNSWGLLPPPGRRGEVAPAAAPYEFDPQAVPGRPDRGPPVAPELRRLSPMKPRDRPTQAPTRECHARPHPDPGGDPAGPGQRRRRGRGRLDRSGSGRTGSSRADGSWRWSSTSRRPPTVSIDRRPPRRQFERLDGLATPSVGGSTWPIAAMMTELFRGGRPASKSKPGRRTTTIVLDFPASGWPPPRTDPGGGTGLAS